MVNLEIKAECEKHGGKIRTRWLIPGDVAHSTGDNIIMSIDVWPCGECLNEAREEGRNEAED